MFQIIHGLNASVRRQVDAVFYKRLSTLLRIVIPSLRSKEALLLVMHSSLLVFRTAISLYVAALDGRCAHTQMMYALPLTACQNRRVSRSCRTNPLPSQHTPMASRGNTGNMDQQLAELYPEQVVHCVSLSLDGGGHETIPGRLRERSGWQDLLQALYVNATSAPTS